MDLGPCSKIHEAALKADFELASKKRDFGYDIDVSIRTGSKGYFYVSLNYTALLGITIMKKKKVMNPRG